MGEEFWPAPYPWSNVLRQHNDTGSRSHYCLIPHTHTNCWYCSSGKQGKEREQRVILLVMTVLFSTESTNLLNEIFWNKLLGEFNSKWPLCILVGEQAGQAKRCPGQRWGKVIGFQNRKYARWTFKRFFETYSNTIK